MSLGKSIVCFFTTDFFKRVLHHLQRNFYAPLGFEMKNCPIYNMT